MGNYNHFNNNAYAIYAVMSTLSCGGSLILICVFIRVWRRTPQIERLFWMSLCDFFLSIRHWSEFILYQPSLDYHKPICIINAFGGTFFMVATMSWYFVISLFTYLTLVGISIQELQEKKIRVISHIYVWTLSTFAFVFPYLHNDIGQMQDDGTCWIKTDSKTPRLVILIPLFIYLLFALFLLIHSLFITRSMLGMSDSRSRVMQRMIYFVGVFFFTWSFLFLHESFVLFEVSNSPEWIRIINFIGVSGCGFFNFLVWSTSPAFRRTISKLRNRYCSCICGSRSANELEGSSASVDCLNLCCPSYVQSTNRELDVQSELTTDSTGLTNSRGKDTSRVSHSDKYIPAGRGFQITKENDDEQESQTGLLSDSYDDDDIKYL